MQVTQTTQLVREVQHIGPDGQPVLVDPYNPYGEATYVRNNGSSSGQQQQPARFANYEHIAEDYDASAYGRATIPPNYADYEPYPHLAAYHPTAQAPPGVLYRDYIPDNNIMDPAGAMPVYGDRPPTPPSPSEQSESPLPHHSRGEFLKFKLLF